MEQISLDLMMESLKTHSLPTPQTVKNRLEIPNARKNLYQVMNYIVEQEQKTFQWLPEYEQVANWLSNDKGKGLLLFGNYGRGKTLLTKYALPMVLLQSKGLVLRPYDVQEMTANVDEILKTTKPISLDDIGTEATFNNFGNKREVFAEIIDQAEKTKRLIVISTNLDQAELINRYGQRVFERIISTTRRIAFNGESLRS